MLLLEASIRADQHAAIVNQTQQKISSETIVVRVLFAMEC
jgi:hypothetical protein